MKQLFFILIILRIVLSNVFGQTKQIATVDSLFTSLTKQDLFSGAVLIADNSQILSPLAQVYH